MSRSDLVLLLIILFFGLSSSSWAGMPSLVGVRLAGMGGAWAAEPAGGGAPFLNPAGLDDGQVRHAELSFARDGFDTAYSYAGYAHPVRGAGAFAAGWSRTAVDFEKTDDQGSVLGTGGAVADTVAMCAAYTRLRWGAVGAAVRYARESIDEFSQSGCGGDIGAQYRGDALRAGVVWRNALATGLSGSSMNAGMRTTESMPQRIITGASLRFCAVRGLGFLAQPGQPVPQDLADFRLTIIGAADVDIPLEHTDKAVVNPGLEMRFNESFALRCGMHALRDVTAGLGLKTGWLTIDYAVTFQRDLESTHLFATVFSF